MFLISDRTGCSAPGPAGNLSGSGGGQTEAQENSSEETESPKKPNPRWEPKPRTAATLPESPSSLFTLQKH